MEVKERPFSFCKVRDTADHFLGQGVHTLNETTTVASRAIYKSAIHLRGLFSSPSTVINQSDLQCPHASSFRPTKHQLFRPA